MSSRTLLKKIILLGDSGTGKTSIINQSVNNKFNSQYKATIGADFSTKELIVDGIHTTLQIWDTAGQERFQSLGVSFYRSADACILVYDITSVKSFENLESWRDEFIRQGGVSESFPFSVIGNKCDLEHNRRVAWQRVQSWCKQKGIDVYFESSAKDNRNIDETFDHLIKEVLLIENKENQNQSEVVQAHIIDDTVEEYVFTCEIIELDKIMISVFNTETGITYKTYIHKNEEWFAKNIHIFRGDFKHVFHLLNDSFINKNKLLPYEVIINKDMIQVKITYTETLFPFELILDIPKYISKNGELEDRVNSLEYQVKKLKEMIISINS